MKKSILTWASCGNATKTVQRELKQLSNFEGIFICNLYTSFKYPEDENKKMIVYQFGEHFISSESANESTILNNLETVLNHKKTYLEYIPNKKFINILDIEIYKTLGLDASLLEAKRAANAAEREEKAKQERIQRENEQREREEKRLLNLHLHLEKLKQGERIPKELFIDLCTLKGVSLHIRTKGLLNRLNEANISTSDAYISGANAKRVNLDKIFEAAKQLVQL